jgi:glycosyltransferase involved in cell wall biosynthesis
VLRNCEGSLAKSIGYALRNHAARTIGWYREHVTRFISASEFLRSKLIVAGFDASRIHVLRNPIPDPVGSADVLWTGAGSYVGYAGRLSPEKGIATILNAAALCPAFEFRLAGKLSDSLSLPHPLPRNVRLVGFLRKDQLAEFYKGARLIISASECYESFGMSVAEAMLHARPVIASRIGVFPEWVRERVNGMLFEPGDAEELAEKVRALWDRPDLCRAMGEAGRQRALIEYSPDTYYRQFLEICREMQTIRAAA